MASLPSLEMETQCQVPFTDRNAPEQHCGFVGGFGCHFLAFRALVEKSCPFVFSCNLDST